jgi:hypothetical protein
MLDYEKREGFDRGDAKFLDIIEKFWWHVMSVAPRKDSTDKQEWFCYSTGLFAQFQRPEIILFGLDANTANRIINEIGNAMKAGREFELGTDYADIFAEAVKCRFRRVQASQYSEYVCWSIWFYEGDEFPVWQCYVFGRMISAAILGKWNATVTPNNYSRCFYSNAALPRAPRQKLCKGDQEL